MKISILGLPQSGQQELFSILSTVKMETMLQKPMDIHYGVCNVRDPRIDKLTEIYNPKKTTYAKIDYQLLPDFDMNSPSKSGIINELKKSDEICWVASLDTAQKSVNDFLSELVMSDMILIEKRIEAIEKDRSKPPAAKEKDKGLMEMLKKQLDAGKPLSTLVFSDEQKKEMAAYQFFTLKPFVLVINVPEDKIKDNSIAEKIKKESGYPCIQVSAKLEEELNQLSEEDRQSMMKELGIEESALNKMTRMVFEGLGLISFFTVGEDEVRAWPVRRNSSAPVAGGAIHTDIAKGFIRAEMFKYADLIKEGSEAKLKELGIFYLKGKDYIVEDGDILSFRFNV
ncbi:MAG: hypothetical protein A2252_12685 [Elusimicrobia bacterium RIFOXYA2_FULL_39_19]|nr:MAG: hypothetical protein A2252_12685 [Elusimicrobia bacterium RIFOXYA2_FULL_39_19]